MNTRRELLPMALVMLAVCACSDGPQTPAVPDPVPVFERLSIQMVPGDSSVRFDTVLATLEKPFRVLVTRTSQLNGNPEPAKGVGVYWRIAAYAEGSSLSVSNSTDDSGLASATVTFGSKSTSVTIEASLYGGTSQPVRFLAHARPGAPTGVIILGGDGQIGLVNQSLPGKYAAVIADSYGNAVGGPLDWRVATGGGSLEEPPCDPEYEYCPASGWIHALGPVDGLQAVTATATTLPGQPRVTFTATGVTAVVSVGEGSLCYLGFDPDQASVALGKTVAWQWCNADDSYTHNVTFEDGQGSSSTKMYGGHTRTFGAAGTYRYRCTVHSTSFTDGEVGTVTVR